MKRAAWWLAMAALALVAVAAQLDRASYLRPELALVVPAPFRSFAQAPMALIAIATESPEAARAAARTLVRRRPMPAENLYVLAVADLRSGDAAGFAKAFERATERGWRARAVQIAAANAALTSGNLDAAANRIAALWALDGGAPTVLELTRTLLAADGGPEAFAPKLAGTKVWDDAFLARAGELASPERALRTVVLAAAGAAQFDCRAAERFRAALARKHPVRPIPAVACRSG